MKKRLIKKRAKRMCALMNKLYVSCNGDVSRLSEADRAKGQRCHDEYERLRALWLNRGVRINTRALKSVKVSMKVDDKTMQWCIVGLAKAYRK